MKYAFIERDLVGEFPLAVICRVLSVTQAGYHAWLKRPASLMAVARDALAELIKRVFAAVWRNPKRSALFQVFRKG